MKKYLIIILLLGLGAGFIGFQIYNKPHKNLSVVDPDFVMTAEELFAEFETNEGEANTKYLDKLIEINGIVKETAIETDGAIKIYLEGGGMMFGVSCQLDPLIKHKRSVFKEGESVSFKGLCAGMLSDVVLMRCVEK